MSIATDGFGSIVAGLESGGGGGTVIPPAGNVSGIYDGNVVCDGEVTLTGNLEVKGSMVVRGDFINDGGYEVVIHGDLHAQAIYFNRADTSIPQSNFDVEGDLIFTYMEFNQCGGVGALLRVGGDLIGAVGGGGTPIYGNGVTDGTPGLNILVYGDMTVAYVELNGGQGNTQPGGNGGVIDVYGSMNVAGYITAEGGYGNSQDAGYGGSVDVYGDLSAGYAWFNLSGGYSNGGNAGDGGWLDVGGNATIDEYESYGGYCYSDSQIHRSGSGGNVEVDGNLTINDYLNVSGGNREGNLSLGNTQGTPNGGYVYVGGDLVLDGDFAGRGGEVLTTNFAPHGGGDGSPVYIYGSLVASDDFRAYGGSCSYSYGGNGGYLRVEGSLHIDDELEFYGGSGNGGNGGAGGTVRCYGHTDIGYIDLSGSYADHGNGGPGGQLDLEGSLTISDSAYLNGGNCNSNNESFIAGYGGGVWCRGLNAQGVTLELNGGDRSGATSVSATGNIPANGGYFNCYGAAHGAIQANGGSVYTDFPNSQGGSGGQILVYGPANTTYAFSAEGGSSVGNNGGSGGYVRVEGFASIGAIFVNGGQANNSVLGGDAGVNGRAGDAEFNSGVTAGVLQALDGSGVGTAPGGSSQIRLAGNCHFSDLNMTDRVDCWIFANTSVPVTLRMLNMPSKKTLNNNTGVPTADISATIESSIYVSGASSTWYGITGTTV